MTQPTPSEEDLEQHFTALSYGLTLEQYRDAQRIARMNPGITQVTKLLALSLKYSPDTIVTIDRVVRGMLAE